MSSLANNIEEYLKKLLKLSASGYIDIRRKELSQKFQCVPSQVNYVLETRFTLDRGYLVESKRGGKGFVRIKRIRIPEGGLLSVLLKETSTGSLDKERARHFIHRLNDEKLISYRETKLMESVLEGLDSVEDEMLRGMLRSRIFEDMVLALLKFEV